VCRSRKYIDGVGRWLIWSVPTWRRYRAECNERGKLNRLHVLVAVDLIHTTGAMEMRNSTRTINTGQRFAFSSLHD